MYMKDDIYSSDFLFQFEQLVSTCFDEVFALLLPHSKILLKRLN